MKDRMKARHHSAVVENNSARDENVKFRVFVSSLARAYFSVCGYASGDAYFSMESPVMAVQTKDSMENSMLLM